ncbi:hypothetical protein BU15DRAFT_65907 [Melanogaster broomeanus]|nr:hypothetical protein BU15DRAFT_65907 [Melanogaster broomeanus]
MSSGTPNPKLTSLTTPRFPFFSSDNTSQGDDGGVEALRGQFERLRGMLGEEEAEKAGLESSEPMYEPYTDDPDPAPELDEGGIMLQQRHIMEAQDTHLDHLSSSIGRQHHISLQINDELEVHTGLLESLDSELDGTDARMTSARKRLARVARGAKENDLGRLDKLMYGRFRMAEELMNMIHIAESTVGRRYAGWFIRNSEHAARVLDGLRASPLPASASAAGSRSQGNDGDSKGEKNAKADAPRTSGQKVAWGGVKAA